MSALDRLLEAYREPLAAAKAHKAAGGRVIAYLCDNVPVELILAAGAFPLRLHGNPARRSKSSERLVDPLYTPDVTQRPGFVSAMIDLLLDGALDFADLVIVPNNRASVQMIGRQLREVEQFCGVGTPEAWLLDKAWSPAEAAREYNYREIDQLRERLEQWRGSAIDDAAIGSAIGQVNAARAAVRAIQQQRQGDDAIAGSLALELIGANWALMPGEFADLVVQALPSLARHREAKRLYLGGSPVDAPEFYRLVEAAGANIVAEDHCWGVRFADADVSEADDPVSALAERFRDFPACSIRFPFDRTLQANLERALEANVAGAIFRVVAKDDVQMWETPEQLKAFRAAGIPTLHLRSQPYEATVDDETTALIGSFLDELAP